MMVQTFDPQTLHGVSFFDVGSQRNMRYIYPDAGHWCAGWILVQNQGGDWMSLRKATDEDVRAITASIVDAHHAEEPTPTVQPLSDGIGQVHEHWVCFHCGFETRDYAEAEAHFGERDDPDECKPLCRWWKSMTPEERGQQLQDVIRQLHEEQNENATLRQALDSAEYRIGMEALSVPRYFKGARTIVDAWHMYDSMEGRALAAEERIKKIVSKLASDRGIAVGFDDLAEVVLS